MYYKIFRISNWRSDEITSLWWKTSLFEFIYLLIFLRSTLLHIKTETEVALGAYREKMQSNSRKYRPHRGAQRSKLTWNWIWRKMTNVHSMKHTWWKYYLCDRKWTIRNWFQWLQHILTCFERIVRPKIGPCYISKKLNSHPVNACIIYDRHALFSWT